VREIETDSQMKLYVLDVSERELEVDLGAKICGKPSLADSRKGDSRNSGGEPWAVVAGNYALAKTEGDAQMLGRLAKIMSVAGAPFLGEADPGTKQQSEGIGSSVGVAATIPEASWIGLAMPRFLLRAPYGKKSTRSRA